MRLVTQKLSFLLAMSGLIFLAACQEFKEEDYGSESSFKLVQPVENSRLKDTDGFFVADFDPDYSDSLEVILNGKEFLVTSTDFLDITGNQVYSELSHFRNALVLGDNLVELRSDLGEKSFNFFFDNHNPRIELTSIYDESAGLGVQPVVGQSFVVEGNFIDPSPIVAVSFEPAVSASSYFRMNDEGQAETVSLENAESFRVVIPAYASTHTIKYTIVDDMGQEGGDELVYSGKSHSPMMGLKVNNSFFENAEPLVNQMLYGVVKRAEGFKLLATEKSFASVVKNVDGQAAAVGDEINVGLDGDVRAPVPCRDIFNVPSDAQCLMRFGVPYVKTPVVDFGVYDGDGPNEIKAHFDIRLETASVDVEVFAFNAFYFTTGPFYTYLGGYKATIGLNDVTLRSYIDAYQKPDEFIGLGDPGDFFIRYTDSFGQALAEWFQAGNVIPTVTNSSCDICKNSVDDILEFLNKYGFIARSIDIFSGGCVNVPFVGSQCFEGLEVALNKILKPVVGDVIASVPSVKNTVDFLDSGSAVNLLNIDGDEPSTATEPHVKQTLYASYINGWNANVVGTVYSAELKISGGFEPQGTLSKAPELGSKYSDNSGYGRLNQMSWTNSTDGKELDFVWAISASSINQLLFSRHQAGFFASDPIRFDLEGDQLDGVSLSLDNLSSRLLLALEGVGSGSSVEVQIQTHQSPQIEFLGAQPAQSSFDWNVFGIQMPTLGGDPAVTPSLKIIIPDMQVVVYANGGINPVVDVNIDLELDAFIGPNADGLPGIVPKGNFSNVRVIGINVAPTSLEGLPDYAIKSLMSYGLSKVIDETLTRQIDGDLDQVNALLTELMVQMSIIEDVKEAGKDENGNVGEIKIITGPDANGENKCRPDNANCQSVPFSALFLEMEKAILYKPTFHWFGVDKSGGWLTMGVDVRVERPDICPQFIGRDASGGTYFPHLDENAEPLTFCIHNATISN